MFAPYLFSLGNIHDKSTLKNRILVFNKAFRPTKESKSPVFFSKKMGGIL